MTNAQITEQFRRTIDQFFEFPNKGYIEESRLLFIGGVLQAALHVLPWNEYWSLKVYCYEKHGYDPGGVNTGEISLMEWRGKNDETMQAHICKQ